MPLPGPGLPVRSTKRRREYATGRALAAQALHAVGARSTAVGRQGRLPVWPPGFTGSISHSHGYCAAAAASTQHVTALGIDSELHRSLPSGLAGEFLSEVEQRRLGAAPLAHPSVLGFSAKEAAFKLTYPLTAARVPFHAARILEAGEGLVVIRPAAPSPNLPAALTVRWDLLGQWLRCWTWLGR